MSAPSCSPSASSSVIGVGLVGLGWGLRVQLPLLRAAGFNVVAVCGRREEETKQAAMKANVPHYYTDINKLLERNDIQLVLITTPPSTHAHYATAVLSAGKSVLLEKPFTRSLSESIECYHRAIRAKEEKGGAVRCFLDHQLRSLPCIHLMKKLLLNAATGGKISHCNAVHYGPLAVSSLYSWWDEKNLGGGIWGAIGSHLIDLLYYLTDASPLSVTAHLETVKKTKNSTEGEEKKVTSDDYSTIRMEYGEGFSATISLSSVISGRLKDKKLLIVTENGSLIFDIELLQLLYYPDNEDAAKTALTIDPSISWTIQKSSAIHRAAGAPSQTISSTPTDIECMKYTVPPPTSPELSSLPITGFTLGTLIYFRDLFQLFSTGDSGAKEYAADFVDGIKEQLILDAGYLSSDNEGKTIIIEELFQKNNIQQSLHLPTCARTK